MKIKSVKIGGRTFKVNVVKTHDNSIFSEQEKAHGYIDYIFSEISLREEVSKDFLVENFLHEVLHGLLDNTGMDSENTDVTIKILAPRLHALLNDNPNLQEMLINLQNSKE